MVTLSHAQLKKEEIKPEKTCLYVTAASRIGRIFEVKDMQEMFGRRKSCRTMSRQHFNIQCISNLRKPKNKDEIQSFS